jgi:hypothetical protein
MDATARLNISANATVPGIAQNMAVASCAHASVAPVHGSVICAAVSAAAETYDSSQGAL